MRCICMMHKSDTAKLQGSPAEICRLLSVSLVEFENAVAELGRTKAATVTQTANFVTLVSRRYARELKIREQNRLRKQRERRHAEVAAKSQDRVISKEKEVRSKKEENTPVGGANAPAEVETLPPKKKPRKQANTPHQRLMAFHLIRVPNALDRATQGKAIKTILSKFSAEDAIACYEFQERSRDAGRGWSNGVSWTTVLGFIAQWELDGKPDVKAEWRTKPVSALVSDIPRSANAEMDWSKVELPKQDKYSGPPIDLGEKSLA